VTPNVGQAVKDAKGGSDRVPHREDRHHPSPASARASFTEDQLLINVKALVDALNKAKPSGAKGIYIKKISLSSTMGPGFKIDTSSFGAAV